MTKNLWFGQYLISLLGSIVLVETKGVNLEEVGQLPKLHFRDAPDEEENRSGRGSVQRKGSAESAASSGGSGGTENIEKDGVVSNSRESIEGSDVRVISDSRDSKEAKLDEGVNEDPSEKKTSDNGLAYFATYVTAYNAYVVHWEPCYMGAAELIQTEETKGVNLENVGQLLKLDAPDEEKNRSGRGSMQGKGNEKSAASSSGSEETKDIEKDVTSGSRGSGERRDVRVSFDSRDSKEAKLDKGVNEDPSPNEERSSDSADFEKIRK
ncbi:hypothetical protein ANCCEY_00165 [Ancylostoma ceylanicum]|uniref:Uncharacterized protein n=1 Tax=Ancylostoma ceylanicum TaxID=53326 RepID=A0A0D6M9B9_9BILA|nr:hypothetical protein ANCCEY_00165 [Ancylostoma ceylanicum]